MARDQAYFKTAFFSGHFPGDLNQVKVAEILRFSNDDGFLFNHMHVEEDPLRWRPKCFWYPAKLELSDMSHKRN